MGFYDEQHRSKIALVERLWGNLNELYQIFCKNPQNLVEQRITPHFLTTDHPNYYEFTTKG